MMRFPSLPGGRNQATVSRGSMILIGDTYAILVFRSVFLVPLTPRLLVVGGRSVRLRSLRSLSKLPKGCTYVDRSIYSK